MKENEKKDQTSYIPEQSTTKPMDSKQDVDRSPDEKTDQDFPGYPHYPAKEDIMDQRTDSHRVDVDVENLPNSRNMSGVNQRFGGTDNPEEEKKSPELNGDDFSDLNPRTEIAGKEKHKAVAGFDSTTSEIGIPQNVDNTDLRKSDVPGSDIDDEERDRDTSDADVTPEERRTLENMSMPTRDEEALSRAALDNTDFDGEPLNEAGFGTTVSGDDLDVPDETDETNTAALGQGDEENKYYSLGSDRHSAQDEDPYSGPERGE